MARGGTTYPSEADWNMPATAAKATRCCQYSIARLDLSDVNMPVTSRLAEGPERWSMDLSSRSNFLDGGRFEAVIDSTTPCVKLTAIAKNVSTRGAMLKSSRCSWHPSPAIASDL